MLVLSRRRDETIIIGDEIEITIVDIRGDTVRLGINAPRAVSVHRKEVYDSIKAENIANMQKQAPAEAALGDLARLVGKDALATARIPGAARPNAVSNLSAVVKRASPTPPPPEAKR
jgi:carbon storage regulator